MSIAGEVMLLVASQFSNHPLFASLTARAQARIESEGKAMLSFHGAVNELGFDDTRTRIPLVLLHALEYAPDRTERHPSGSRHDRHTRTASEQRGVRYHALFRSAPFSSPMGPWMTRLHSRPSASPPLSGGAHDGLGAGRRATRRDVLKVLAIGGAASAVWGVGALYRRSPEPVFRAALLMGTGVRIEVLGDDRDAATAAAEATLARMAALEAQLSRYRADSEVGRLNATGRVEHASPALLEVLQVAERVARLGDGAFDVTVQPVLDLYRSHRDAGLGLPTPAAIEQARERVGWRALRIAGTGVATTRPGVRITLDGVAKGYIVDRGVEVLRARGFPNVFVEAGGDLMAAGDKGEGSAWRVGIRQPRGPGMAIQARLDARNRAVATSGDYQDFFTPDFAAHHIIDPRTRPFRAGTRQCDGRGAGRRDRRRAGHADDGARPEARPRAAGGAARLRGLPGFEGSRGHAHRGLRARVTRMSPPYTGRCRWKS